MTIRKRLLCLMLAASMLMMGLSGCKDSSNTLTWQFSEKNLENLVANWNQYDTIPEEDRIKINDLQSFMSTDLIEECGVEDFHDFIENEVEPLYPTGISFEDWLAKAKEIDGITTNEYDDIAEITMND